MITSLLAAALGLFYVNVPVEEMREEPEGHVPVVSQAYYSERVNVLERRSDRVRIATEVDGYRGWVRKDSLFPRENAFPAEGAKIAKVCRPFVHLYAEPDTSYGPYLTLPFESLLEVLSEEGRWVKVACVDRFIGYIQAGDISIDQKPIDPKELPEFGLKFLGLPYTWGGRSGFGYDCSGFVQMLYRQAGIYLPRDSKDQVAWDRFVHISEDELTPGDLVFFGSSSERIGHVGMYIGEGTFIHATVAENAPTVHVSKLSDPDWNGSSENRAYRTCRRLKV